MRATYSSSAFVIILGVAASGCSADEPIDVLTYDEFKAQAYQEPGTGNYIVNGDELVETEDQMRAMYEDFLASAAMASRGDGYGTLEQAAIVNRRSGGADDKWTAAQALDLRYCISSSSFGNRYNTVVSAMNSATAAWEGAGRINFVHVPSLDGSCNASTSGVVFDVRQVSGGGYLARAFFPSSSRASRNVLIDSSSFGNISPYTLTGILRHELGHAIGLRHEHTRPEAGRCFEDNNWRALTVYDRASVMHYPQCNGSNTGDLVLTTRDRQGTAALYP